MGTSFEDTLTKHKDIYQNLVTAAYSAYCSAPLPPDAPRYSRVLYRNIELLGIEDSVVLALEDICQQVLVSWWRANTYYWQHRPNVRLKKHLIYMTLRDLQMFFFNQSHKVTRYEIPEEGSYQMEIDDSPYHDFKLDLVFLLKGTHIQPFSILNSYERHLLYLKYREEKNIDEIARLLQRDKHSIAKHLSMVITKLKEL